MHPLTGPGSCRDLNPTLSPKSKSMDASKVSMAQQPTYNLELTWFLGEQLPFRKLICCGLQAFL